MKKSKKDRLAAAGFVETSIAELLDLSAEEVAMIEIRVSLAQELKRRRMKKGMSQAALAALIGSSQPRVAKMEQGDPSCSVDLLMKALLALGVHRRTLGRLLAA